MDKGEKCALTSENCERNPTANYRACHVYDIIKNKPARISRKTPLRLTRTTMSTTTQAQQVLVNTSKN